jgi:oxygen-independent coproporphyrinogen-3 oxidase
LSAGLYVHVPFCARACPYCDFDFVVDARPAVEPFIAGLEREISARDDVMRRFGTVYVGGGTPSVFSAADLRRLLHWIRARFDVAEATEWTVECNPEHVDAAHVEALLDAGVGRISLGVQSL